MKKYFVQFTYRKNIPANGGVGEKLLTFEIIELQPSSSEIQANLAPEVTKEGILLALGNKGYEEDVNVLLMNPL